MLNNSGTIVNNTANTITIDTSVANLQDGGLVNAGAGTVRFDSGTTNYDGTQVMNGNIQIGLGTQNFNDGLIINGTGDLTVLSGARAIMNNVTLNKALLLTTQSTLSINNGKTLTASGGLTADVGVDGDIVIDGVGGTLLIPTNATATVTGATSFARDLYIRNITLNNQGTLNLNHQDTNSETYLNNGAVLNNSGTLSFSGSSDLLQTSDSNGGAGVLNNSGTIVNNTANTITIDTSVANLQDGGLVNAGAGTVRFDSGTTNYDGTQVMNGNIQIGLGTQNFNDGLIINGTGDLTVLSGARAIMNNVTLNKALLLTTQSTLSINNGKTLTASGGLTADVGVDGDIVIDGVGGTLLIPTNATATVTGATSFARDLYIRNITLNNQGTLNLNHQDTNSETYLNNGAVLNNSGTLSFSGSSDLLQTSDSNGGAGVLNNSGTIVSSTGLNATIATTNFNNTGGSLGSLITGQTGGLNIQPNAVFSGNSEILGNNVNLLANTQTNNGTLTIDSGVTFSLVGKTVNGAGTISNDGTLDLTTASVIGNVNNQGTLDLTSGLVAGNLSNQGSLNLNNSNVGGNLTNTGNISQNGDNSNVTGTFDWQSGTISGSTQITAGDFIFTGAGTRVLDGATIITDGLDLTAGSLEIQSGQFAVDGDADIGSNASLLISGGDFQTAGILNNAGTIEVTASDSISTLSFNNTGTVSITNGSTLSLSGDGVHTGSFVVESGATLEFVSGNIDFDDGADFDGAGLFTKGVNANLNLVGLNDGLTIGSLANIDLTDLAFSGNGTLTNLGTVTGSGITLDGNFVNAGNANFTNTNFDADFINLSNGSATIDGGSSSINGNFENSGTANLTNITFNGNFTNLASGITSVDNSIINGNFENSGNVTVLNTLTFNGAMATQIDGALIIENGNTFSVAGANSIFDWQGGSIGNNAGLAGNFTIAGNNAELRISGNGVRVVEGINITYDTDLNLQGELRVSNNGTLTLNGANNTFTTDSLLSVIAGTLNLNGATNTVASGATLSIADGSLNLSINNTLVVDGSFNLSGGVFVNDGNLNVGSTGLLNRTGGTFAGSGQLANTGTLDLGSGNISNAITNNAGATINANGATFQQLFTNNGNLNLSGNNTFQSGVQLNAGATLQSGSGAIADLNGNDLNLNGSGSFDLSGITLDNVGSASVASGQTLNINNTNINSTSHFESSGDVIIGGSNTFSAGYVQNAGSTNFENSGTPSINTGTSGYQLVNGVIGGTGTINGDLVVGSATLAPGFSPGTITVNGNLILNNSSILNIELGGTGAGSFDVLNVLGNATLGGTLNVLPFSGFAPSAGNVFNFMSFAGSSGGFSTINISPSLAGLQFTSGSNFLQLFVPGISPSTFNNLGGFVPANDILIAFDTLNNPLIDSNNDNLVTIEEADESLRQCI